MTTRQAKKAELQYLQTVFGRGAKEAKQSPVRIRCSVCQGENVWRDAWAEWNAKEQHWELSVLYDQGFCQDCDEEASLEEVAL